MSDASQRDAKLLLHQSVSPATLVASTGKSGACLLMLLLVMLLLLLLTLVLCSLLLLYLGVARYLHQVNSQLIRITVEQSRIDVLCLKEQKNRRLCGQGCVAGEGGWWWWAGVSGACFSLSGEQGISGVFRSVSNAALSVAKVICHCDRHYYSLDAG